MKLSRIKPNLPGIMLIVLGMVIIVLAFLFFIVDPNNNEKPNKNQEIYQMA